MVFLAGGVGINPLISMVSFIAEEVKAGRMKEVPITFLYSVKRVEEEDGKILFVDRLEGSEIREVLQELKVEINITEKERMVFGNTRITEQQLIEALGEKDQRKHAVLYVCGPPNMTDKFVEIARPVEGMLEENILFEKWW